MTPLSIRYALMLFLAIGLSRQSPAQSKHIHLEIAYSQGGFYTHRSLRAPLTQPMRGLDLNVCRPTDGARRWQQLHGYPDMALQLRVRDMGNPQVYGYVISVIPYLQFYPLRRPSWRLAIAHGTGLCYITRQYSVQNLANQLISSHLNVATFLRGSIYLGRLRWQAALNL